jgi:hypothetical protein
LDVHLELLQEKLNAYRRFIESGELLSVCPNAAGRNIAIEIVGLHEPGNAAAEFLNRAREVVAAVGFELRFRLAVAEQMPRTAAQNLE